MAKKTAVDHARNAINQILKRHLNVAKANKKSEAGPQASDFVMSVEEVDTVSTYLEILASAKSFEVDANKPKVARKPRKAKATEATAEVPAVDESPAS